jgi:pilus assembly protein FimV
MDMGDEDGARQILEEVAADGDAEQQQEARTLLERLG